MNKHLGISLLLLLAVWGCSAAPTVIETKPVTVKPPPIVINNAPTVPYTVPADTALEPSGATVIMPADSGYVAQDSTNGSKVEVRVHLHRNAPPTVSVVANPAPAVGMHTDTVSGRVQNVVENKPTFGQLVTIVLITVGVCAIVLFVLILLGKVKPL